VSHDERLIEMVCTELWAVDSKRVRRMDGGLKEYRKEVQRQLKEAGVI
jgi:ATPase subunit of ABC transporter with duplicated ATPase domains